MQKLKLQTCKLNTKFLFERNRLKQKNLYHYADGIVTSYIPSKTLYTQQNICSELIEKNLNN